jgi:hypothetical protein
MQMEPALQRVGTHRVVVKVTLEGRDGVGEREIPSAEFETTERGLTMGPVLVPWARVFRYEMIVHQAFVADEPELGSRVMQRVVYQDERGRSQVIEVPLDRFEHGPWAVTVLADREIHADQGEILIRKVSIPWHRVIETERIFAVPEATPSDG